MIQHQNTPGVLICFSPRQSIHLPKQFTVIAGKSLRLHFHLLCSLILLLPFPTSSRSGERKKERERQEQGEELYTQSFHREEKAFLDSVRSQKVLSTPTTTCKRSSMPASLGAALSSVRARGPSFSSTPFTAGAVQKQLEILFP